MGIGFLVLLFCCSAELLAARQTDDLSLVLSIKILCSIKIDLYLLHACRLIPTSAWDACRQHSGYLLCW